MGGAGSCDRTARGREGTESGRSFQRESAKPIKEPLSIIEGGAVAVQAGSGTSWPRVSVVISALNEGCNLPYVSTRLPADVHKVIAADGR